MKRIARIALMAIFAVIAAAQLSADAKKPKFVFYLIGDGMGINQVHGTGIYSGDVVNFTTFPYFTIISSYAANAGVTDSAAAGTALATGEKTNVYQIGTAPDLSPLASVADYAKMAGYGVGIVTSVGVNHATPSAFYGKAKSRSMYDEIAAQLIDSKVDYAAGSTFLSNMENGAGPLHWAGKAEEAGIKVIYGPGAYEPTGGRVIHLSGVIGEDSLPYRINRKEGDTQLCDFVEGAIEHLYSNYAKKGFFLMIEGGKIDYACHDRDAAAAFEEVLDFAEAAELVLDFYRRHSDETLIVVTADHETGGMSLGNGRYELHIDLLHNQKVSKRAITDAIYALGDNPSYEQVKQVMSEATGLWTAVPVTEKQENVFRELYERAFHGEGDVEQVSLYERNSSLADEAVNYLDRKAMVGWIASSHTASPLGVWSIGPGADKVSQARDNTDVPKIIEKVAGYVK